MSEKKVYDVYDWGIFTVAQIPYLDNHIQIWRKDIPFAIIANDTITYFQASHEDFFLNDFIEAFKKIFELTISPEISIQRFPNIFCEICYYYKELFMKNNKKT